MTKRFIAFAAIAALLVAGCGEEQKLDFQPVAKDGSVKTVTLKAGVPETKVLADNAGTFKWQNGDRITVVTDGDNISQFTTTDSGLEATFSGTIPAAENIGAYALYPASENHVAAGDMIEYHLDNEIVWKANASNMPMLGKVTGSGARFKAIGGVLKIVLYNIPAEADYLQFSATSQKITGAFDIDDASAANVTIATADTDVTGEKELLIDFSADYSDNKVFYIPLPTGTINGFTFTLLDSEYNELFSKTSTYNLNVVANHLILGPALNCSGAGSIWSEDFSSYADAAVPSGKVGDVTYTCVNGTSDTKVFATGDMYAGGDAPELLIGKKEGSFTVSNIPTNGLESLVLTFKTNRSNLTVSTATDGIVLGSKTNVEGTTYSVTITNTSGAKDNFTLMFAAGSDNARIDDIVVKAAGSSAAIPVVTSSSDNLTIAVGKLSQSATVGITNAVDDLGIACIINKKDDKPIDWIKSAVIEGDKLTVTANDANGSAEDREAIITLRASGAQPKIINVKQTSALVQKPEVASVPGSASFSASWIKNAHATSYVAYLHTSETATPAIGGTELTPSLDGDTYTVTASGLTNGSIYYLYVKVVEVATNYIAEDAYTTVEIVPDATIYYVKVESNLDDWSGEYLIVWDNNVHYGIGANGLVTTAPVSISAGKIASAGHDVHKVIIEKGSESYYIKLPSGKYLSNASGSNTCVEIETRSQEYTFSINEGKAIITGAGSKVLQKNASYYRFYGNNDSYAKPELFKLEDPRADAGMSWSAASASATIAAGGDVTFSAPTLTPGNATGITYNSTDTDVATISNTGVVTIVGGGTTSIQAIFAGDATYKPATVSYTLAVTDNRVTYDFETIAELNALITSTTPADYSGYLTDAVVSYVPNTGNAIIKDATGSVLVFKSGHGLKQGQTFTGPIEVTVTLYNTTAEITALDATFTGSESVVAPAVMTLEQLVGNFSTYQNAYVQVSDLTVTGVDTKNISVTNGGKNYLVYDNAGSASVSAGDVISVTGTVGDFKGTNQIKVWSSDNIVVTGGGSGDPETTTDSYTFTSNSWGDSTSSWDSGKNGNMLTSGRGVQITTSTSGANATTKSSYTDVSKVVVTYSTNASNGAGSISVQIGSNSAHSQTVTKTGGTNDRTLTFTISPNETGTVKLSATCTTNSIYIKSVAITHL